MTLCVPTLVGPVFELTTTIRAHGAVAGVEVGVRFGGAVHGSGAPVEEGARLVLHHGLPTDGSGVDVQQSTPVRGGPTLHVVPDPSAPAGMRCQIPTNGGET
jgi:hypothetical protein